MQILEAIVTAIIGLWLGSMEYRMRKLREDSSDKVSRKEVNELIDLKQEVVKQVAEDTREDIREIKQKLDKLLERH